MPRPTTFSLSVSQLDEIHALVQEAQAGDRQVLGAFIEVVHAKDSVDPPMWRASVIYNPADGGEDLLGDPLTLTFQ